MAQPLAYPIEQLYTENTLNVIEDYVFETPITLSASHWQIQATKGDIWVFCNQGDYILHTGDAMQFNPNDDEMRIKRLYVKSVTKYKATSIN